MNPYANTVKLKAHRQQQIMEAIDSLPADLQTSVKQLFELIRNEDVQEISIDNLDSLGKDVQVRVKRNNTRHVDDRIQFANWGVVRLVLNEYLIPLTETNKLIEGEAEGFLELFNLDDLSQPSHQFRVHAIAPLEIRSFAVTIIREI